MRKSLHSIAAALLMGGSAVAMAANDGFTHVNGLLETSSEYRSAWSSVVKKQERVPDWIVNLSGYSEQPMTATTEDHTEYLVGTLCETAETCKSARLIVAAGIKDKDDLYAMLVEVPKALPADKTPSQHATISYLGKPDEGMQKLLNEKLKQEAGWY